MDRETYHIGLWNYSKQFFNAAEKVRGDERTISDAPTYYLYGHSIELILKAFLVFNGASEKEIREIGHNLGRALEQSIANGIDQHISNLIDAKETIELIGPYYEAKELEYIATGGKRYPTIIRMHSVSESLIYSIGVAIGIPQVQLNKWVKRDASR